MTNSQVKNIMIVGVGGQGTLLASRLLGKAFVDKGCDVKVSEVHGMSQRGGSVVTYVRYGLDGAKVFSPLIEKGEADIIISFEQLEGARWLPFLRPDGVLITSTQIIHPMPVISGAAKYPENILEKLAQKPLKLVSTNAPELAREAGSSKAVNVVLLGVAARYLGFEEAVWSDVIKTTVPPKTIDINLKAFDLGYNATNSICFLKGDK